VAAAYIVFVVVLVVYLGIMALRTGRTNRELDDLRRELAKQRVAQERDSPSTPAHAPAGDAPAARRPGAEPEREPAL
jgi:hypothetical protein